MPPPRVIGAWGTAARVVVGAALLVIAFTRVGVDRVDLLLGVVVLPAVATILLGLRGSDAQPLRLSAGGHLVTIVVASVLLIAMPAPALLFYGGTMLLAARCGSGGCEVTAVSNQLRGRDDRLGCPLFAPIDALDARLARRKAHHGATTAGNPRAPKSSADR